MLDERKEQRRLAIEAAAYDLLAERGYAGMSMLALAKAAGASNETLYNWYGDKAGLLAAMIARNAEEVLAVIAAQAQPPRMLEAELESVGRALLTMLLGERSVALNRAAASDASGELGRALAAGGRARGMPALEAILARHGSAAPWGEAETFLALLLGDWPQRRLIGAMAMPDAGAVQARLSRAVAQFLTLRRAGAVNKR